MTPSWSSYFVIWTVIAAGSAARVPCAAHQNVDGLGCGSNQPNVITQSVTWDGNKKGASSKTFVATETPNEDIVDAKMMRLVRPRCRQCERATEEYDDDFELKLNRLVKILENIEKKDSQECDAGVIPKFFRRRRKKYRPRRFDSFEDDYTDVPCPRCEESYEDVEIERPRPRKSTRKYVKFCDSEESNEEYYPPRRWTRPVGPKMDWLVLKKPKRHLKNWTKNNEDSRDSLGGAGVRDILYIPQSSNVGPSCKFRKTDSAEYSR